MEAGKLNRRVTIQRRAEGEDAYGQPAQGWADVVTVWAAIDDMKGRQFFAAQADQSQVHTKITIRYMAGVEAAMRVLHGTVVYDIHAVLGQDRIGLELMCARGVNNG
jgi:SPP1 family predicted phage head-tail adaptor